MLNLAMADVLHGLVTTTYFYPPIVFKRTHIPEMGIRIYNVVDWTAWAITLTHMSAICLDRLIAIILYGRYNQIVTLIRVRRYSLACWMIFLVVNGSFYVMRFCCMIRPLKTMNFYSFGYAEHNVPVNAYVLTYTPIEILTITILTVSNPITLIQLYRRHKRKIALRQQGTIKSSNQSEASSFRSSIRQKHLAAKAQRSQWQRASTMLIEMSMKMGANGKQSMNPDVRELANRRANRQQQRILLQITVVALIFYAYMTAYYVSFYSNLFESKVVLIFNSFFYSFTHMINPIIYFSLNKEMRAQLRDSFLYCCGVRGKDLRRCGTRTEHSEFGGTSVVKYNSTVTHKRSNTTGVSAPLTTITNAIRTDLNTSYSEMSPLIVVASSSNNNQTMYTFEVSKDEPGVSTSQSSSTASADSGEDKITQLPNGATNHERRVSLVQESQMMMDLPVELLRKFDSYHSLNNPKSSVAVGLVNKSSTFIELNSLRRMFGPENYHSLSLLETKPLLSSSNNQSTSESYTNDNSSESRSLSTRKLLKPDKCFNHSYESSDDDEEEEIAYL
ncbi:hypothetical protein WR25_05973 [Diploscapter pachys]|uniref:G-protein coupled receptors family 1 profile domain-containing protein n=1 Tax=Diploscapter pachys TaxID=2018661 RepID=A0A2A2LQH9_9BILA|nr:hypothetical protein WR25_05973 [Diploscapter pachys]